MGRRRWLVLFLLVVAGVAYAAGSTGIRQATLSRPASPTPSGRLAAQALSWGPCAGFATSEDERQAYAAPGLQCAYLDVPVSYADPNGPKEKIGVLRSPASDPKQRIGSLVVNPGGPGASGMSAAAGLAGRVAATDLGRRFDLVGFDPRGVGASRREVHCLTPPEQDAERQLNLDVDTSPAGVARTEQLERADSAKCAARSGTDLLANVGTRDVVRDLDALRAALGDPKLTYLGYSYGTLIGTRYAETFPGNVRAMILDGVVDPETDPATEQVNQSRGFQDAFDFFAATCTARPDCALGRDRNQASTAFQRLVRPLIKAPVPVSDGRKLSYSDATTGAIQALYLPALWPALNRGLTELSQTHNGDTLMQLADLYYDRAPDGTYSNQADAFQAVRCVDSPPITDPRIARETDARVKKVAPFLDNGAPPSPARDICAFWPVPPTGGPHKPHAPGLPPVLVISTTHDPATPYQAGVELARDLNGRLLTFNGAQHTAFLQGNQCVDQAGTKYLTTLALPPVGSRC